MLKELLEKKVNSMIETNDLTDMQVWGVMCGIGFILALIITSPKLFSAFIKTIFYSVFFQKEKREIYFCRLSGIFNSVIGNKSWYRPSLD